MAFRSKSILLASGLTLAALAISLIPQAISQESRQSAIPLKDVCREGWSRYKTGLGVRLCVSPDVEQQGDFRSSAACKNNCAPDAHLVPEAWAHATAEEVGYLHASGGTEWAGYEFRVRVVNVDSSLMKSSGLERAVDINEESFQHGSSKFIPTYHEMSLASYGLPFPERKVAVADVCPPHWSRFSCQFVRLCVSPSVAGKYNLATSNEFGYADCKADDHTVPAEETHSSPSDVGFAAGALLTGPRYFKSAKLDSSDIFNGDIEEAIQRLVLVPIPTSGLMDYDRGFVKGQGMFKDYLTRNGQKDKNPQQ